MKTKNILCPDVKVSTVCANSINEAGDKRLKVREMYCIEVVAVPSVHRQY
jgi:hypothetical protein